MLENALLNVEKTVVLTGFCRCERHEVDVLPRRIRLPDHRTTLSAFASALLAGSALPSPVAYLATLVALGLLLELVNFRAEVAAEFISLIKLAHLLRLIDLISPLFPRDGQHISHFVFLEDRVLGSRLIRGTCQERFDVWEVVVVLLVLLVVVGHFCCSVDCMSAALLRNAKARETRMQGCLHFLLFQRAFRRGHHHRLLVLREMARIEKKPSLSF